MTRVVLPLALTFLVPTTAFAGPLDALLPEFRTTYRTPSGAYHEVRVPAIVQVPTPIDVDGSGTPDVLAQVTADLTGGTLRVALLPGAPSPLPLKVEAIMADLRLDPSLRVAYGYDALTSTAPAVFDAALTLVGTTRAASFGLDLRTSGAGPSLGVLVEIFTPGEDDARIDPQRARFDFTPVPTAVRFAITGSTLTADRSGIDLVTDVPTRTVVRVEDVRGDHVTRGDIEIDLAPNTLSMSLVTTPEGHQTFTYTASARVGVLHMNVSERDGGAIASEVDLRLEDVAQRITLVQDTPEHVTFSADSPIGVVQTGLADGGPIRWLSEPAYMYADDRGGVDSTAFRIEGLSAFESSTGDPLLLDLTVRPGPFHILQFDGSYAMEAWLRDLPARLRIEADLTTGSLRYTASDVIEEITVDATDPAGFSGRATEQHLVLRGLPTALDLTYSEDGGTVSLDAHGQTIGLIDAQLTSGPDRRLPDAYDGVLLEDLDAHYVLHSRLTGLRKMVVTQGDGASELLLETAGGRVLHVDHNVQLPSGKVEYARTTLDALAPRVRIGLVETATGQRFTYEASAPSNSLSVETNAGDRWRYRMSVANPLPGTLEVCQATDGLCTSFTPADGLLGPNTPYASSRVAASETTEIDLFDCVAPADASCESAPQAYSKLEDWKVRLQEAESGGDDFGFSGYLYLNTTDDECAAPPCRYTLSGRQVAADGAGNSAELVLPEGFWADDHATYHLLGLVYDETGAINCPPGTSLTQTAAGTTTDLTYLLCGEG